MAMGRIIDVGRCRGCQRVRHRSVGLGHHDLVGGSGQPASEVAHAGTDLQDPPSEGAAER